MLKAKNRLVIVVVLLFAIGTIPPSVAADPIGQRDPGDDLSILLLGADAGPERSGTRTDSIIVARVDRETGRAALFSIPRNMVNVPLPERYAPLFDCGCWGSLINELYGYANANPDLFGGGSNPGAEIMKVTIGNLLGINIDDYALVDLPGFVDVIDAVGGVTIDVPRRIRIYLSPAKQGEAWAQYDIQPGRQHLDGRTALAYVRSRLGESDYERMARQRCLLGAIAKNADISSLLTSFHDLTGALENSLLTDVPRDDLPDLIEFAGELDLDTVATIGFTTSNYMTSYIPPGYPVPNPPVIQQAVSDAFALSLESVAQTYGTIPTACGWSSS
jgi:LCP family protein required for cell wall assembly